MTRTDHQESPVSVSYCLEVDTGAFLFYEHLVNYYGSHFFYYQTMG